jgi:hypothetical protein
MKEGLQAPYLREHVIFQQSCIGERDGQPETMWEWTGKKENLVKGLQEELDELVQALVEGSVSHIVEEAIDLSIRIDDAVAHILVSCGFSVEDIDRLKQAKLILTKAKYAPENFAGKTIEEAKQFCKKKSQEEQF